MTIALFSDATSMHLLATGMLARGQPRIAKQLAFVGKLRHIPQFVGQHPRTDRPTPRYRAIGGFGPVRLGLLLQLRFKLFDLLVKASPDGPVGCHHRLKVGVVGGTQQVFEQPMAHFSLVSSSD